MTTTELDRRSLLLFTAAQALGCTAAAKASASAAKPAPPPAPTGTGKPGEFEFLAGEWRIQHRKLKSPGVWDEFAGEATCWSILGGVGSIEELRIPARDFAGMGIRLLELERKVWSDFWVNAKSGVLATPGMEGAFEGGVGTFTASETIEGKTSIYSGVWDQITASSCRWRQGMSTDGGATWEYSWFMQWTKVG
jgi:hypothetical protein